MKMEVVEGHRTPITRQVQEGVQLEMNKADIIMNSKSELNSARLPRIVIEVGDDQEEDKESGMTRAVGKGKERQVERG